MNSAVYSSPTNTSDLRPASISTTEVTSASAREEMSQEREDEEEVLADGKKRPQKGTRRRKVNQACLYCRRSHMTCDEGRPCQRW